MTEKRFIPIFDGIDKRVVGAKDNGVIISFEDMFNLLNELHEENEQLKLDLKVERDGGNLYKDLCEALEKENEQLKKQVRELVKAIQDTARMSADAICKPMKERRWGDVE